MVDWELQLPTTIQHQERELDHLSLAQEEIKIETMKHGFLLKAYCFSTNLK
jgi:hypothetical protein